MAASFYGSTNTGDGNTAAPTSNYKESTNYEAFTDIETASAAAQAAAASAAASAATARLTSISFVIDGGGSTITSGLKGFIEVPFNCTLQEVQLLADVTGSIIVDIWKAPFASFPPNSGNSITAAAKPTISSGIKYIDTTLTGWTTSVSAGDILAFNVNSASTIQRVTVALKALRT